MKNIYHIEILSNSKEEVLPGFTSDFPYIASCVHLDHYADSIIPWHWHNEVEIFYMKSGSIEYNTPRGTIVFPEGSGGFINANVLHMTRPKKSLHTSSSKNLQLVHIFDPLFIAGQQGSRIEQKYIMPVLTSPQLEIIPLYPDQPEHVAILDTIRESFLLEETADGYELQLRTILTEIWFQFFQMISTVDSLNGNDSRGNSKIKQMMVYIHEHYSEKITIADIAASAYISERECFRTFRDSLHTTPVAYIRSYRLQKACHMLANGQESITAICHASGLGSSSYFGKIFHKQFGCTPNEYRHKWQNSDR